MTTNSGAIRRKYGRNWRKIGRRGDVESMCNRLQEPRLMQRNQSFCDKTSCFTCPLNENLSMTYPSETTWRGAITAHGRFQLTFPHQRATHNIRKGAPIATPRPQYTVQQDAGVGFVEPSRQRSNTRAPELQASLSHYFLAFSTSLLMSKTSRPSAIFFKELQHE
jgi:hypothetical protein